jgi:anti-sigma B factor antagonist
MPASSPNGHPVLRMSGDLDLATEAEWRRHADELLEAHPDMHDLVVDLGDVGFVDSRGMAVLVHLHTSVVHRGGQLSLREVPRRVAKALRVAGLDQVFTIDGAGSSGQDDPPTR